MDKEEIIRRLKKISRHAVHVLGEPPFIMNLDDGIALDDAVRLLKENEWVSVKDRLPDEKQSEITHDFEYVICATTFGDVRVYKFGTPIGWKEPHFWNGCGEMDKYVTHWMPMPEMPDMI